MSNFYASSKEFIQDPSPRTAVGLVVNFFEQALSSLVVDADEFFAQDDWVGATPWMTNSFMREIVQANAGEIETFPTKLSYELISTTTIEGIKFGWKTRVPIVGAKPQHDGLYVDVMNEERYHELITRLSKRFFGGKNVLVKSIKNSSSDTEAKIVEDIDMIGIVSKTTSKYVEYLRRCVDTGVFRSVLFYGRPGTGKSTMMRDITRELGMRSLRIRISDFEFIDIETFVNGFFNVVQPDVVMIDDFDRFCDPKGLDHLLEMLERIRSCSKIMIATANDISKIQDALLRPGRFDEIISIEKLDDDIIRAVLGEENVAMFDTVKEWPIAFVNELKTRIRFMDKEDALESVKELGRRVNELSTCDELSSFTERKK